MTEPRDGAGDEMNKLVAALQDWARRAFDPGAGAGSGAAGARGDGPHGAPSGSGECLPWCPICQFAHVLRGEHPEIGQRVAEAGTALAAAMKALADATVARAAQPADPGAEPRARPRPAPRIEHIRLDDPDEA